MKDIELWEGDCIELMDKIPDNSIDLVLCDLPYGTTVAKWDIIIPFDALWRQYLRVGKDTTPYILFGSEPFTSLLITSNLTMFKYRITWDKIAVTGHLNANKMPMQQVEDICVFYKKPPTYNPQFEKKSEENLKDFVAKFTGKEQNNNIYGNAKARELSENFDKRFPTNLIRVNAKSAECNGRNRLHPTQKPVELLEKLILTYSNESNLVLDNTMGVGSTVVASKKNNRKAIGIEKEKKYFDIAVERIDKM